MVWGDRDRSYGWSQPEALWYGIRNTRLAVLPGCVHYAHDENPVLFNAIAEGFIDSEINAANVQGNLNFLVKNSRSVSDFYGIATIFICSHPLLIPCRACRTSLLS